MVATYFPPMAGVGTVRVTKYVKYVKKFNWNPTVVTISESDIKNYDNSLIKDIDSDIEIVRLETNVKNNHNLGNTFYKVLKKNIDMILNKKQYDAIFITGGPFEPMNIAPYIYKKYKIPYIIDLRDPWKLQKINRANLLVWIKSKIKRFIIGFEENRIFKNAFAICTVNDTMTKQYRNEYKKWSDKFYTISNGYDKDDYKDIRPKKTEVFSIVYSGKFNVSAGFRDPTGLFKAIKAVNDKGYKINFIHIGQEENSVIDIAKKENVIKYCSFIGSKTYKETLEYCKGANLLVVIGGSEKSEQTGKIFDYIGCKRPILAIADKESEIGVVCSQIPYAHCIEKDNINDIINSIIFRYKNQQEELMDVNISNYEREHLTYQLVQILEKVNMNKDDKKRRY